MRAWLSSEIRRKHFNPNGYVVLANDKSFIAPGAGYVSLAARGRSGFG